MISRTRAALSPIRMSLLVDAAGELAGAVILAVAGAQLADAFNVDRAYIWVGAAVFLAAAVGIGALAVARVEARELVLGLAGSNISAGIAWWIILALAWSELDPGGRWVLAAAADTFILIGILELVALRRSPGGGSA